LIQPAHTVFPDVILDITDRQAKRADQDQLLRELSHRARTMQLAVTITRQDTKDLHATWPIMKGRWFRAFSHQSSTSIVETDWMSADASQIVKRILSRSWAMKSDFRSLGCVADQHAQTFAWQ